MPLRRRRSDCPISVALELFGDPWSLLIMRDLTFKDLHTFKEFLDAGEGIATNILTDRLARLAAAGLISKESDPADGRARRYTLTDKGLDLAPMLMEMVIWSAKHERTAAPPEVVERMVSRRRAFLEELRARRDERRPVSSIRKPALA